MALKSQYRPPTNTQPSLFGRNGENVDQRGMLARVF
jgi:hypothetical protein